MLHVQDIVKKRTKKKKMKAENRTQCVILMSVRHTLLSLGVENSLETNRNKARRLISFCANGLYRALLRIKHCRDKTAVASEERFSFSGNYSPRTWQRTRHPDP